MSKTISLLTIVDSVDIANNGITQKNTSIVDNQYLLKNSENSNELITACKDGDIIQWKIVGIRPNAELSTTHYRGQAVSENVINPKQMAAMYDKYYWTSRVELGKNSPGTYQYYFDIKINNIHYYFNSFINVSAA